MKCIQTHLRLKRSETGKIISRNHRRYNLCGQSIHKYMYFFFLTTNIIPLSLVTSVAEMMIVEYLGLSEVVLFLQLCHIVLIWFKHQLRSNRHRGKEFLLLHAWLSKNTVTYICTVYSCKAHTVAQYHIEKVDLSN